MPKKIFSDHDIEDLVHQGVQSLSVDQNTLLTDLAYEKAHRLGLRLVFETYENPPSAPVRPYLSTGGAEVTSRAGANATPTRTGAGPAPTRVGASPTPTRMGESPAPTRMGESPAPIRTGESPAPIRTGAGPTPTWVGASPTPTAGGLRFTAQASEAELRAAVVEAGRLAYAQGLMISNDGNISVRMGDGRILITPSGVCKGRIGPQDLLIIDLNGNMVQPAADPALKPTSEQPMHLEVYRQRADVRAVIHTHLIFANALVISKGAIRMDILPETIAAFGSVPVTDFCMPSSEQNAEAVRSLIPHTNVLMIRNHGSLTVGANLDEALIHLERLEHIAKTLTFAELLGSPNPLPPAMLAAITQVAGR